MRQQMMPIINKEAYAWRFDLPTGRACNPDKVTTGAKSVKVYRHRLVSDTFVTAVVSAICDSALFLISMENQSKAQFYSVSGPGVGPHCWYCLVARVLPTLRRLGDS
jgi:hypothetical protein